MFTSVYRKMKRTCCVKNKFIWVCGIIFVCLVVVFLKRGGVSEFYGRSYSAYSASGQWPPKLKIIKKAFASSSTDGSAVPSKEQRSTTTSVKQQACRFPELLVDDPDLKHLFYAVEPLKCAKEPNWVYVRNGTFYIDPDAASRHGGDGAITCDYTNFWRETDYRTVRKTEENFANGTKLRGDFFKVDCRSSTDGAKYSNVHAAVVPPPGVIDRCREAARKKLPNTTALGLNVYILGFDSISRMTFMRKLPKTYKYLTETMGSIVLKGYNIVGDGTPQALIPILTGKTEVELPLTRKRYRNAQFVNVYPFVWNEYRDAGYATLYGEDAASIGTFTYRLKGFDAQPTDHYMRTFYTVAEGETSKHPKYCWGSEPHHKVHFGYVEHFWESYPLDVRKFAFQFHSIMSHDDINAIGMADDDMVEHLRFFTKNGYSNDTVLIFMADHGHRFDKLRETQQGKLEERMPFFSFAFPPWFREKYPTAYKAFRTNAERLTTPFDIHATLKSILDFNNTTPPTATAAASVAGKTGGGGGDDTSTKVEKKNRELSLFDYIPSERSCADADIEAHWCACLQWSKVEIDDPVVQYAAKGVVHAINLETERERGLCAVLRLHSITKASSYSPSSAMLHYKGARDKDGFVPDLSDDTSARVIYYQINLRTKPGDAHYEASVSYDLRSNEVSIDLDTVSHVNKFGDAPHCIIDKDYFLAKWCVCLDKVQSKRTAGR